MFKKHFTALIPEVFEALRLGIYHKIIYKCKLLLFRWYINYKFRISQQVLALHIYNPVYKYS